MSGPQTRAPGGAPGAADLSVQVGSLRLRNPLLAASGCFGYGSELAHLVPGTAFGGIVTKTILEKARPGNPPPRIVETPSGLINSIGLEGIGIDRYIAEKIPLLEDVDTALIVSIGGHDVAEFARLAARLDRVKRVDALEINISCPNVDGGTDFSTDPKLAADTIRSVRRETGKPVWAKLTPGVTNIAAIGRACEEAGADALSAVNTFTGLSVNVETGEAVLPRGAGGVSGPAIRPLALARVRDLVRAVAIPVVGIGGIATARDVLEFLITGAAAVQLGTVLYVDPTAPVGIAAGLQEFLQRKRIAAVRDVIGTLKLKGAAR